MSRKIWTVEDGKYSDYHLIGVYSTRAGAEEIVRALGCGEVVERVCNPGLAEIRAGLHLYLVWMRRDGQVERCERQDPSAYDIGGSANIWRRPTTNVLSALVYARDDKQAVKAANEMRALMIVLNQWPAEPGGRAEDAKAAKAAP